MTTHTTRWYGVANDAGRTILVPRNPHMQGRDWGWEAHCSCGWSTRTGGAIQQRIREAIADHKHAVAYCAHRGQHHLNPYSTQPTVCTLCGTHTETT